MLLSIVVSSRRTKLTCNTSAFVAALLICAGCSDELSGPAPELGSKSEPPVAPAIACGDQLTTELTLHGAHFSPVPVNVPKEPAIALPSLTLTRSAAIDGGDASEVELLYGGDPTAPSNTEKLSWNSQQEMEFTIDQSLEIDGDEGRLPSGIYDARVVNPNTKQASAESVLAVVDKPTLSETSAAAVCLENGAQELSLSGTGFLRIQSGLPSLRAGDETFDVGAVEDCTEIAQDLADAESCETARLTLAQHALPPGSYSLVLTNPETAACHTEEELELRVVAIPTISAVNPTELCADVPTTFTVTGTDFDPGAKSSVDGVESTSVNFVSPTEIQVMMPGLSTGMHSFTVTNAGTCAATRPAALTVDPSPIVFFADPPVTYKEIPVEVTIFTSGLSTAATKVELVHDGTRQELTFTTAGRPNKMLAQVPAGLAAGAWDVVVTNAGGCPGTLAGGLTVTDTLTGALVDSIKPSYASTTQDTAVTISGSGLSAVPRVYLTASGSSGSARALRAVEVTPGGAALTAVIPSGFTPGAYDLIVVNPDGKVDVLDDGVTITAEKPPVITSVTPASLPSNASGKSVTIAGSDFKSGLSVQLDCMTTGGTRTTVPTTEQAPAGDGRSVVVAITMSMGMPTAPDAGSVCLVRLTNSDGAFFEYSAFSVTNSSLNLSPWQSAPDLQTARRALSLVAGRPTSTSRYLYAIGGDSGTNMPVMRGTSVFDSVEASQVDVFGVVSDWSVQRNHLVAPRTAAGAASIGRFVYLLGGHDGTSATNTLLRAAILDPLAGPEIDDIDATLSDGSKGLNKGLYYYRVSALRPSGDLSNPGGETLSGELLPVQLPERAEKIALALKWTEVAGAHGYRIYRSPQPDAAADSLQLLGEITCGAANDACNCASDPSRCRWVDEGTATQASGTPLPAGSLGVWHAVDGARCSSGDCLLGSAREGLAVTAFANPGNANQWYLYAFGGRNQSGTYLDSYEVATVTLAADGSQTVADFAPGSDTLAVPCADLGLWVLSKHNSGVIAGSGTPDDVWVYAGGGSKAGTPATNDTLEAGKLGAGGILNAFVATDDPLKGALVGFGSGASNDQLYTFGGQSGTANGTSAQLCGTPNSPGSCGALPDLRSGAFNALGAATTQRMFTASAQESAFFFVAGGHDGSNAIKSVQRTVQ